MNGGSGRGRTRAFGGYSPGLSWCGSFVRDFSTVCWPAVAARIRTSARSVDLFSAPAVRGALLAAMASAAHLEEQGRRRRSSPGFRSRLNAPSRPQRRSVKFAVENPRPPGSQLFGAELSRMADDPRRPRQADRHQPALKVRSDKHRATASTCWINDSWGEGCSRPGPRSAVPRVTTVMKLS